MKLTKAVVKPIIKELLASTNKNLNTNCGIHATIALVVSITPFGTSSTDCWTNLEYKAIAMTISGNEAAIGSPVALPYISLINGCIAITSNKNGNERIILTSAFVIKYKYLFSNSCPLSVKNRSVPTGKPSMIAATMAKAIIIPVSFMLSMNLGK